MQVAICTSLCRLWEKMPKILLENPELLFGGGGQRPYCSPNQIIGGTHPPGFGAYDQNFSLDVIHSSTQCYHAWRSTNHFLASY